MTKNDLIFNSTLEASSLLQWLRDTTGGKETCRLVDAERTLHNIARAEI